MKLGRIVVAVNEMADRTSWYACKETLSQQHLAACFCSLDFSVNALDMTADDNTKNDLPQSVSISRAPQIGNFISLTA